MSIRKNWTISDVEYERSLMRPDLPDDIICLLFQILVEHDWMGTLKSSLRVCSKWCAIGTPMLWKDVYLFSDTGNRYVRHWHKEVPHPSKRCNINKFFNQADIVVFHRVQALTIDIAERYPRAAPVDSLLKTSLRGCEAAKRLKCLSLYVSFNAEFDQNLPSLDSLERLRNLPTTVESLELTIRLSCDSGCLYRGLRGFNVHICQVISHLLPQLKHVQLECGEMCEDLWDDIKLTGSNLETLLINTSGFLRDQIRSNICPVHRETCGGYKESRFWQLEIARQARELISANSLPKLRSFLILGMQPTYAPGISLASFTILDVLGDTVEVTPASSHKLDFQRVWWLRLRSGDSFRDEFIDSSKEAVFESEHAWISSVQGWRFPRAFVSSKVAKQHRYRWKPKRAQTKPLKDFWLEMGAVPVVIALETHGKQVLVEPQVLPAAAVMQPLSRALAAIEWVPGPHGRPGAEFSRRWQWTGSILEKLVAMYGKPHNMSWDTVRRHIGESIHEQPS